LSAYPFIPFTYHYFWESVAFTVNTDKWSSTYERWTDTTNRAAFDHTFAITAATRRALWKALDYFDPFRPNRIRIAGWITNLISIYEERIGAITSNLSELLDMENISTVPLTKDNSRYLSKYRIMGIDRPPLQAGQSSRASVRPEHRNPTRSAPLEAKEASTTSFVKDTAKVFGDTMSGLLEGKNIIDILVDNLENMTRKDLVDYIQSDSSFKDKLDGIAAIITDATKLKAQGMVNDANRLIAKLKPQITAFEREVKKIDSEFSKTRRDSNR
jgi:hypothetical protein